MEKLEELLLNDHKDYVEQVRKEKEISLSVKKYDITPYINKINFYEIFDPYYVKPVNYNIKSKINIEIKL